MYTGKLNRLNHLGWVQRAAERRERRRSRGALDVKPAVHQADVVPHTADPEAETVDFAHLDQREQSDSEPTKDDEVEGYAAS